ncbi:hypothetical protein JRI60_45785 [Archangium violaceum]|uniref:hypothetical protein n=1 Tax=Archangium violaceum TaxID=83451 RepID=UPI001951303A|nr:hypothetical protein [Archangium violaceum]QRN96254.1 hypothetical protein JRI60_45785 [Archangium violaceum]
MLVPAKLNTVSGLLVATLPAVAVVGFGSALLSFVGGRTEVWRMADTAGPYSLLMAAAVLGVMVVLSMLLSMGLTGRHAPLVVLVGIATLPWFLGIAGTDEAMERVLAALPDVGSGDALSVLVAGTGEAMVTRLLGAWASAALLVGVAVGLVLLRGRAALVGEGAGQLLGAALSLALGSIALLVALEAHQLFQMLTTIATQAPEARAGFITSGTERLAHLEDLRSAALVVLAILALSLVSWQFYLRPQAVSQWAGSLMLAGLSAAVLLLDARPLELAARGAREAGLSRTLLPLLVRSSSANALGTLPSGTLPSLGGIRTSR